MSFYPQTCSVLAYFNKTILLPDYTILADDHLPEVNTTVGVVKGRVAQAPQGTKVNEYLGVPFARPPVGDLRYSDPVPLNRLPTGTSTFALSGEWQLPCLNMGIKIAKCMFS